MLEWGNILSSEHGFVFRKNLMYKLVEVRSLLLPGMNVLHLWRVLLKPTVWCKYLRMTVGCCLQNIRSKMHALVEIQILKWSEDQSLASAEASFSCKIAWRSFTIWTGCRGMGDCTKEWHLGYRVYNSACSMAKLPILASPSQALFCLLFCFPQRPRILQAGICFAVDGWRSCTTPKEENNEGSWRDKYLRTFLLGNLYPLPKACCDLLLTLQCLRVLKLAGENIRSCLIWLETSNIYGIWTSVGLQPKNYLIRSVFWKIYKHYFWLFVHPWRVTSRSERANQFAGSWYARYKY